MSDEQTVSAVIRASRPSFRNKYDTIAFAVHASFLSSGFLLTATGPAALADDALSSPSDDEVGIDNWNGFDDHYAFVYANPKKESKKVLVKCLAVNGKLLVDALADGSSQPVHLEIDVDNFVGEDITSGIYPSRYKNLKQLVSSLDKEVISNLYGSSSKSNSSSNPSQETGEPRSGVNDPGVGIGINEPTGPHLHPSGVIVPPIPSIGGSDLFPGPGAGIYPTRGNFGGGSMLLGPNDPRWFGGELNFPGGQPGVPPGGRFDPIGPPDVPGFEPFRFARNPRRPGRGANHPDLEHFGNGSDFI